MTTVTFTDIRVLASEVDTLLKDLQGELETAMDPHRVALRHLKVNTFGGTKEPYNDEAFTIWSNVLKNASDDIETIHHMAILHHSRAFDLEMGVDSRKSNSDWELALGYWYYLWQSDAFWDRIAEVACKNTKRDAVDLLRERFPSRFLQIHFDIAFDHQAKNHRTNYHIKLALDSPFPEKSKRDVRRETYERFIRDLPSTVWTDDADLPLTQSAMERIEEFLKKDPFCFLALEDALRLQVRLLFNRFNEFQAAGTDERERTRTLDALRSEAGRWRKYFDSLVAHATEITEETRPQLALWYRVMGDVFQASDKVEEAVTCYEHGITVSPVDHPEYHRCHIKAGEAAADLARERAHNKDIGARELCDRVRARNPLSVYAHYLMTEAYMLLGDFKLARKVCQQGLKVESDLMDWEALDRDDLLREKLREQLEFLQGLCRLQDKYGMEGLRFRNEAIEALNAGNLDMGIARLEQAIPACPAGAGRKELRQELAQAITNRAVVKVNEALSNVKMSTVEKKRLVNHSIGEFDRAIEIINTTTQNEAIEIINTTTQTKRKNFDLELTGKHQIEKEDSISLKETEISSIANQLHDHREELVQISKDLDESIKHEQLISKYGGYKAFELQQKSVIAYNSGNIDNAISYMIDAIKISNNKEELLKELLFIKNNSYHNH